VGNNTPAIMMTLCFVGGKERQKSPDHAGCVRNQLCKRIALRFLALRVPSRTWRFSSLKIERTAKRIVTRRKVLLP
jgi:hypothetical protein